MRNFIHCFRRESADHWTCLEACELVLPSGRIPVAAGTIFTDVRPRKELVGPSCTRTNLLR